MQMPKKALSVLIELLEILGAVEKTRWMVERWDWKVFSQRLDKFELFGSWLAMAAATDDDDYNDYDYDILSGYNGVLWTGSIFYYTSFTHHVLEWEVDFVCD